MECKNKCKKEMLHENNFENAVKFSRGMKKILEILVPSKTRAFKLGIKLLIEFFRINKK